jgi:UDP-galactopyranose mutase
MDFMQDGLADGRTLRILTVIGSLHAGSAAVGGFEHETLDMQFLQPVAVVNYPNDHAYTRVTEFKHLTGQRHRKTSVVYEYPAADGDPFYPVPNQANAALYKRYANFRFSS